VYFAHPPTHSWVFTHPIHWNPVAARCQGGWKHRHLQHHHSNKSQHPIQVVEGQFEKTRCMKSAAKILIIVMDDGDHGEEDNEKSMVFKGSMQWIKMENLHNKTAWHFRRFCIATCKKFFANRADRRRQIKVFDILTFCNPDARTDEQPEKVSGHASLR